MDLFRVKKLEFKLGIDPGTGHRIHKTVFVSTGTTTGTVGVSTTLNYWY